MFHRAPFWIGLLALVVANRLLPARLRPAAMAAGGAALIFWLSPAAAIVAAAIGAWAWLGLRGGPGWRWAGVAGIAGVLLAGKILARRHDPGWVGPEASAWLPIGFSYLIFRMLHVLAEPQATAGCGPAGFWAYVFFPPMFPAGPIDRIDAFAGKWPAPPDAATTSAALVRILIGVAKKALLCDFIAARGQAALDLDPMALAHSALPGAGKCWATVALVYLRIYLDMSAYADIAIGSGGLLGFRLMENFHSPLLSVSAQDFWRRWHISLARWCASYIYMPLVGALRRPYLPLFAAFLVMGLWHFLGWNRVGWAAWQAMGVLACVGWRRSLDRRGRGAWRKGRPWRAAAWALTQGFVIAGFAFLAPGEHQPLGQSLRVIGRLFSPWR